MKNPELLTPYLDQSALIDDQPSNEDSKIDGNGQTMLEGECPENLIGKKFKRVGRYQLFFCAKFSQYALGVWILNIFSLFILKAPTYHLSPIQPIAFAVFGIIEIIRTAVRINHFLNHIHERVG